MTAKDIISAVDELKPNEYTKPQKLAWLTQLDRQLLVDVILKRLNSIYRTEPSEPQAGDLWLDKTILKRFYPHVAYAYGYCNTPADYPYKTIRFDLEGTAPDPDNFVAEGRIYNVTMQNANTAEDPQVLVFIMYGSDNTQTNKYFSDVPLVGTWAAGERVNLLYRDGAFTVVPESSGDWAEVFPYTKETDVLLFDEYAREVYIWYLITQIDLFNMEYLRYNNSSAMLNQAYLDLERRYNRSVGLPEYRWNIF